MNQSINERDKHPPDTKTANKINNIEYAVQMNSMGALTVPTFTSPGNASQNSIFGITSSPWAFFISFIARIPIAKYSTTKTSNLKEKIQFTLMVQGTIAPSFQILQKNDLRESPS